MLKPCVLQRNTGGDFKGWITGAINQQVSAVQQPGGVKPRDKNKGKPASLARMQFHREGMEARNVDAGIVQYQSFISVGKIDNVRTAVWERQECLSARPRKA